MERRLARLDAAIAGTLLEHRRLRGRVKAANAAEMEGLIPHNLRAIFWL